MFEAAFSAYDMTFGVVAILSLLFAWVFVTGNAFEMAGRGGGGDAASESSLVLLIGGAR